MAHIIWAMKHINSLLLNDTTQFWVYHNNSELSFVLTDGENESLLRTFHIEIHGENSGEIHFHSVPMEVREGEFSNVGHALDQD